VIKVTSEPEKQHSVESQSETRDHFVSKLDANRPTLEDATCIPHVLWRHF